MNDNAKRLREQEVGRWLWDDGSRGEDRECLMFRSHFQLEEMPGTATMWISAEVFFLVAINGRVCSTGPVPNPGLERKTYAVAIEVGHLLDIGENQIAVIADAENAPLSSVSEPYRGIWMKIEVDGEPKVWSDESWLVRACTAFLDKGLRTGPCDVFTACVDLGGAKWERDKGGGGLQTDWMTMDPSVLEKEWKSLGWHHPHIVLPVSEENRTLVPFDTAKRNTEISPVKRILRGGVVSSSSEISWVNFGMADPDFEEGGVYIADAYIWSEEDAELSVLFLCDDPYLLYVNGECVKRQAVQPLVYRSPLMAHRKERLQPQDYEEPAQDIRLESGWNHLMVVQDCYNRLSGFSILWPELAAGTLQMYQKADATSDNGWSVQGPVSLPMSLIHPALTFDGVNMRSYIPNIMKPYDISAYYLACRFDKYEAVEPRFPLSLAARGYAVCDFGYVHYGNLRLELRGDRGDIVDIVMGEHLLNGNEVLACQPGERRNVTTLILDQGLNAWHCIIPAGIRYVMVVARSIKMTVQVRELELWQERVDGFSGGQFSCSLPVLEDIWKIGVRTLMTTMQRVFIDSPTGDQAQGIADGMIQASAGFYVFGSWDQSERGLENFAYNQFETGELNSFSPSALFQPLPDYSLCWPVWLYRHYMVTGNEDFLRRMMPYLEKLLTYYNGIATYDNGPLGDLQDYLGVFPLIDYGNMERRGMTTALNGLYCRALRCSAMLFDYMKMPDMVNMCRRRAQKIASAMNELCWNEEQGLFADSYVDGAQSASCGWRSNVLAIYGGIARPEQYEGIWEKLFNEDVPLERYGGEETENPYFKHYILETAFALNKSEWALRLIYYYWGQMLRAGATTWWEMYAPEIDVNEGARLMKRCSGSAVSPNIYLITELVGIRPTSARPGMEQVFFNPCPGDVTWVRAVVPTCKGSISVSWKLDEEEHSFTVNISATYPIEVIPVLNPEIAEQAIFNVSDNVTVLAE